MASKILRPILWSHWRAFAAGIVVGGLLLIGMLFLALKGLCVGPDSRPVAESRDQPSAVEELYLVASGLRPHMSPDRVRAARALARDPEAEPWLVLLFLSSQTAPTGDEDEEQRQRARHESDLGVVAVAVNALPKEVPPSVQLALTFLLTEQGQGRWSETSGTILLRMSDYSSRPIRELARAYLKDSLGVDCEWDTSAWREAITKITRQKMSHGVRKTSITAPESQPARTHDP